MSSSVSAKLWALREMQKGQGKVIDLNLSEDFDQVWFIDKGIVAQIREERVKRLCRQGVRGSWLGKKLPNQLPTQPTSQVWLNVKPLLRDQRQILEALNGRFPFCCGNVERADIVGQHFVRTVTCPLYGKQIRFISPQLLRVNRRRVETALFGYGLHRQLFFTNQQGNSRGLYAIDTGNTL